jgi:F0F1-type ATP synthase assembly protein I
VSQPPDKNGEPSALKSAGLLLAIPTLLIVSPIVGYFVGSLADRWLKWDPWGGIVGLMLGFAAGGRETYRIYRRYQAEEERRTRR